MRRGKAGQIFSDSSVDKDTPDVWPALLVVIQGLDLRVDNIIAALGHSDSVSHRPQILLYGTESAVGKGHAGFVSGTDSSATLERSRSANRF